MLDDDDKAWIRQCISEEIQKVVAPQPTTIASPKVNLIRQDVANVFIYWKSIWNKSDRTLLDSKRKRVIEAALKNYSVELLQASLFGYSKSEFHTGKETGTVYDDISLHLRDAAHVEAGLRFAEQAFKFPLDPVVERGRAVAAAMEKAAKS